MTTAALVLSVAVGGLALLLALAGGGKLRRPQPAAEAIRALGLPAPRALGALLSVAELVAAGAAFALPGRAGAAVIAGAFAGLAGGSALSTRRGAAVPCGCFGDAAGATLGPRHTAINAVGALVAVAAVAAVPAGIRHALVSAPALWAPVLAVALALRAWLRAPGARLDLQSAALALVDTSAGALEARFSRRSALQRLAVAGSALSVAPLRYMLYPTTAMAVVVPGECADGLCADGYTSFCCELNQGLNGCPAGTFIGGWWMCTDYRGRQLCQESGVRYYVDCNALPGRPFPGGCRCTGGTCAKRRQNCNIFRYGQCNTQIAGTTAVVCRVITCENPANIHGMGCNHTRLVNDATCGHEAPCLEPPAVQLPGSGGA